MGQIDRLKRITKARIEAFLDSLETPEVIFPQLIKELSAKVKEAGNAEAKALSAVKADLRRLDQANGMVLRFKEGAGLAVNCGDVETAKQAISAQIHAEQKVDNCKNSLTRSESAYAAARQVRLQLQENLKYLKARKNEILRRHSQAQMKKQMLDISQTQGTFSDKSIMDAVARIEEKVQLQESHNQVQSEISRSMGLLGIDHPDEKADELEVQRRLNKIIDEHGKN